MLKNLEEKMDLIGKQMVDFSRATKTLKKKKNIKNLELKKYISRMKNGLDGFNSDLGTTEEKISEVKVGSLETMQAKKENAIVLELLRG